MKEKHPESVNKTQQGCGKLTKLYDFFLVANEERNLRCYPKLQKLREREVFGTMKCLPWKSQLINGCGDRKNPAFV